MFTQATAFLHSRAPTLWYITHTRKDHLGDWGGWEDVVTLHWIDLIIYAALVSMQPSCIVQSSLLCSSLILSSPLALSSSLVLSSPRVYAALVISSPRVLCSSLCDAALFAIQLSLRYSSLCDTALLCSAALSVYDINRGSRKQEGYDISSAEEQRRMI